MRAAVVVILLSLCASLALPVPVDKSDQRRDGREISVEELESQLEDIENRISAVRTKVKQEAEENKEKLVTTKGTPPTSPTEKLTERTTQAEEHTTVGNVKTTEKVQIIVEKETSPSPKTTPRPTPTEKATSTKISQTTTSAEKTPVVEKVEVVQQEEEQEKPEKAFVVKKVTEEVEEKEETAEEPEKIKDTKVANDETDWDEEADLESGRKEKSEKPTERVNTGKAPITTPVKTAETEFKVEKITPSPKSPTTSEQSEVKVEHVPPKLTVETKRSRVERIEEDEDLQEGGESKSSDGERKVEIKVEKESSKEPSPAKSGQRKIIVEVEKISPSTDETDAETDEVEGTERGTAKPTATREVPTSKRLVDEVSISVEKITPSKRPTSGKPQSAVVNVVKENSEDEDLETRSENEVNSKRSDIAPAKTRDSNEEAALELELEGGQDKDKMENQKDKIDEEKLAQEFDKALKAERNGKEKLKTVEPVKPTSSADGLKTTKPQQVTTGEVKQTTESKGDETAKKLDSLARELEKQNDEAALEKEEAKKDISVEELELAELAQDKMNDDDKEETKPTIKPTTATPKDVVIKVEKVPKVTVQVTKVNDKRMPSEKETAKEEKKMKDELASELQQEKEGSPPVIMKVEKLGGSPDAKPAAEKAQDDPEVRPDNKESAADKEEEEQESELEGEIDTKTKRAASVTRNDLEEQLENLLAM